MTKNQNIIEEKIFAFFDGELNDSDEAQLMNFLAKDKSARDTFKFYLKLNNSSHDLKSVIIPPQDTDYKIYHHFLKIKHEVPKRKALLSIKDFLWHRYFSLRPIWAVAASIILVIGTLLFSKFLPTARLPNKSIVNTENIDEIRQIRKHIPKVKLTLDERVK